MKNFDRSGVFKLLVLLAAWQGVARAEDAWQINTSVVAMTGQYANAMLLREQRGTGLQVSAEKDRIWGVTAGLQTTHMDLQPIVPTGAIHQNNWLLSGFARLPSSALPGLWTLQLDAYKSTNDAADHGRSNVQAIAPQVTWMSFERPLKLDFAYASSKYQTMNRIIQRSASVAYGFNSSKDWVQVRSYDISHLTPAAAMGQSQARGTDIALTHFLTDPAVWQPVFVSLRRQTGQRIYYIDVDSQVNFNLPMRNDGGTSLAARWAINPKTALTLQWMNSKLFTNEPLEHRFSLNSIGLKVTSSW